jgi:F-type H+-transporting ATPase subunit delta
LFDVASKANNVAAVEANLSDIATLIAENPDFRGFLTNPLLSRSAQANIVESLLKKMNTHALTIQFIALLARHKRLENLAEIIALFAEMAAAARGELVALVQVAAPISATEAKTIEESLSKAYGRKVTLKIKENPELLGGTIIKIGSQQIDGSLAGKLNRLQQELKAA